jgi:uncharacterized protein YndB with AHSA1/START domain
MNRDDDRLRQGDIPGVQLRRRIELPLTPADLWPWLVSADRLERWLAARAEVGMQPGAIWELEATTRDGTMVLERLEVLDLEEPRRLRTTLERKEAGWGVATLLELSILPSRQGCELSVWQSRFEQLPLSLGLTAWELYRRRWREALRRLEMAAAGAS